MSSLLSSMGFFGVVYCESEGCEGEGVWGHCGQLLGVLGGLEMLGFNRDRKFQIFLSFYVIPPSNRLHLSRNDCKIMGTIIRTVLCCTTVMHSYKHSELNSS